MGGLKPPPKKATILFSLSNKVENSDLDLIPSVMEGWIFKACLYSSGVMLLGRKSVISLLLMRAVLKSLALKFKSKPKSLVSTLGYFSLIPLYLTSSPFPYMTKCLLFGLSFTISHVVLTGDLSGEIMNSILLFKTPLDLYRFHISRDCCADIDSWLGLVLSIGDINIIAFLAKFAAAFILSK